MRVEPRGPSSVRCCTATEKNGGDGVSEVGGIHTVVANKSGWCVKDELCVRKTVSCMDS